MYGDLQLGHFSPSFSSFIPQFPQIATGFSSLKEEVRSPAFSITFLISAALTFLSNLILVNKPPLSILEILRVFSTLRFHRIIANYIPGNQRSQKTLNAVGFEREGYAKSYLKIAGKWQDHVLTALINPLDK